ncbi:hypothetical protein Tco_1016226 [Tanacetum coccineum]|uniref:Uncharacterized protein n=1 Tax=Tanacetum coccineum TaxID=301880 RepID=A0ABQ5FN21_9ASTR
MEDDDGLMTGKYCLAYTQTEVQQFHDTLIQHIEYVKKSIDEREPHKREYDSKVNERLMQTTEGKVDMCKALDASLISNPIYDEEPMAEVQSMTEINVFAIGQQHAEQPKFNNKGEVDQNVKQSHCINLELKLQNNVLKSGQHGQFSNGKSNEAKVTYDIDEIETINIKLEHSVAKLLAENEQLHKEKEHLKQTYKDLYDSIKKIRVQTKDQNDSLIAQLNKKSIENADLKAQIQEKVFATAALKNELRKLKGNSVDTKFSKPSILGNPILQPLKKPISC